MNITVYNRLKKYDGYLQTAHKMDFIRSLSSKQIEELSEIGDKLGMPYKHNGCPKCILNYVKRLAVPYFEQKEKLESNKKGKKDEDKG